MSENENSLFISQRSAILPIPFVKKPQKLKTKIRNYFGYNHLYFLEEIQLREFDCLDNEFTRPNRGGCYLTIYIRWNDLIVNFGGRGSG